MKQSIIIKNLDALICMPISLGLIGLTIITGTILVSSTVSADDSVVDDVNITVPVSCSMSGTGMDSHNANISNGTYQPNIGTTTIHAFCNDNEGFAIYAAGYTGNEIGATNSNKLVGTNASGNSTIDTGLATTAGTPDVSNWAMKLAITQDSGDTTGTNAFTIDSNTEGPFSTYHTVPNTYTKVAHKTAATNMTASTGGVKLTTTYAAYISKNQSADTYSGQVKYTLVHPSIIDLSYLNVIYDGNGLVFDDSPRKTKNIVKYDVTENYGVVNRVARSVYNEDGSYTNYGDSGGNNVVVIPGASSIRIRVTYGIPSNANSGPPSSIYIWSGKHPDYTDMDKATSLANCGGTSATNGAFQTNGSSGSQTTITCVITGDSVTFYDYQYSQSSGYFAAVSSIDEIPSNTKTMVSGDYATPITAEGNVFLGWSLSPDANANAESPIYTDGEDFINNSTYTKADGLVTLYAVWGKSFNNALNDSGRAHVMQDVDSVICRKVYVGAIDELLDTRDNSTYIVGRLKDGRCWMLDNLALDIVDKKNALNSSNTNATDVTLNYLRNGGGATSDQYATGGVINWEARQHSYSVPLVNMDSKNTAPSNAPTNGYGRNKVGGYYNYCAATAGSYCYGDGTSAGTSSGNATEDICPKGWRMPIGGTNGEFSVLANIIYGDAGTTYRDIANIAYRNALSLPASGTFSNGGYPIDLGDYGRWWSSTRHGYSTMYVLDAKKTSSGGIDPTETSMERDTGYTIRCLVDE